MIQAFSGKRPSTQSELVTKTIHQLHQLVEHLCGWREGKRGRDQSYQQHQESVFTHAHS